MSAGRPANSSAAELAGTDDLRRSADTAVTVPAPGSPPGPTPVDLFGFLRILAVASYRGVLTRKQAALAQMVALDSDGATGTGVIVRADHVALELGISESQVWRQFGQLRDAGWFEQTARPARGSRPGQGRRARYRTMCPPLDFGLGSLPPATDHLAEPSVEVRDVDADRFAESGVEVRDDRAEIVSHDQASVMRDDQPPAPETSRSFGAERLAVSDETSRIDHAQRCDSLPSDGVPSDGLPSPVVDLGAQPQDRAREDDSTTRNEDAVAQAKALARQQLLAARGGA